MASLPTELIISIITRLPSKSLFRFKCVSKTWNSLISSPHLIKLHLAHSLSSDRRLLILNYGSRLESTPLKWGSELDFGNNFSRFDLPTSFSGLEFSICGCCDGLIALICKNDDDPQSFKYILWNPCINSHFILPSSIPVDHFEGDSSFEFLGVSFGFGYDCENDDYKIVRIVDYFHQSEDDGITSDFDVDGGGSGSNDGGDDFDFEIDDEDGNDDNNNEENVDDGGDGDSHVCRFGFIYREVMMYSLKENSWKLIHVGFFGDQMKWFCPGAVVNSVVHWVFWKYMEREPQLRGFDLSSFEWTELALPDFKEKEKIDDFPGGDDDDTLLSRSEFNPSDIVVLGVLDGCLCLVTRIGSEFECDNAYVWVMKEYGVKDSWTKLFNVSEASLMGPLSSSPLGSSKEGDEVLLRKADEDALCCYDLRRKIVKGERKIRSSLKLRDVKLCVESLVPVTAPAPAPAPEVDGSDVISSVSSLLGGIVDKMRQMIQLYVNPTVFKYGSIIMFLVYVITLSGLID